VGVKDGGLDGLEQALVECAPHRAARRATGDAEEVLFVISGSGELRVRGERHTLEPETGVQIGPGQEYELRNEASDPLLTVCVRIRGAPDPDPEADADPEAPDRDAQAPDPDVPARVVVRRLADQKAHGATSEREFRIVADPSTGLQSATQFVGYIPPGRAPDHFHTYDEVIYVIDGEGALHIGGERTPLNGGSRIELPARTVHCLENTGQDVLRLVAVFRPAGSPAAAYLPDGTPAYPGTPKLDDIRTHQWRRLESR
jgi:mannose-6-phosphate isomerase-like protein (cupin superfamily)